MATHNASQGLIKVGSETLGELKSFNFSETAGTIETTTLNDSAKTYSAGATSFSGSAEAYWDNDDAAQNALAVGSEVQVHFYPEGATTGDKFRTGTILVSEISTSLSTDGTVDASFSFTGSGVLTEATVA